MHERRLRKLLPVLAAPLALALAASSCADSKAEAFRGRRPAIVTTIPEARPSAPDAVGPITIFSPTDLNAELRPIEVPTATDIRKFLPRTLNPEFLFENEEQKKKDTPSFVTISPVVLNRVVSSEGEANPDGGVEASVGQKYLEFRAATKDSRTKEHFRFWISFSDFKPDDKDSLIKFEKSYPPGTLFRIMMPVAPHKEFREATKVGYEQSQVLTPEQAAAYEQDTLQTGASALAGRDRDVYLSTVSTDYIKPI